MNRVQLPLLLIALVVEPGVTVHGAGAGAEIAPSDVRRTLVEKAERLAQPPPLPAIPPDVPQPFSPPGFDKPDSSELRDKTGDARSTAGGNAAPTPPAAPTDRDVLAVVAAKIPTTGTIIVGGTPLLISGMNRIEVGSHFTVVYNGQEYELALTAIDRTTFTVRYKGEEFTRPIKIGKSP